LFHFSYRTFEIKHLNKIANTAIARFFAVFVSVLFQFYFNCVARSRATVSSNTHDSIFQ